MPVLSGIEAAIRELQREQGKIQDAISALSHIRPGVTGASGRSRRTGKRRLSAEARERISQAAKKRWAAARRASKKKPPKAAAASAKA